MRIVICEDSVLLREGLVRLLEDAGMRAVSDDRADIELVLQAL